MKVKSATMSMAASAALTTLLFSPPSYADTSDATRVTLKVPFAGLYAKESTGHPSQHHIVESEPQRSGNYTTKQPGYYGPGDWSLDYHGVEGTSVRFDAYASGGTLTAKVWAVQPTCTNMPAGKTVFVDLYVNGLFDGWVSYGHLDQVAVTAGQSINPSQLLGKTRKWDNVSGQNCWVVNTALGTHVHMEMWGGKTNFACYKNYQYNTNLGAGMELGVTGRTIYTTRRARC